MAGVLLAFHPIACVSIVVGGFFGFGFYHAIKVSNSLQAQLEQANLHKPIHRVDVEIRNANSKAIQSKEFIKRY